MMYPVYAAGAVLLTLMVAGLTTDSAPDVIGPRAAPTLKFVFVVSRHGNRGAYRDYAQDPYPLDDPKYFPYGNGALTPKGREHMYKLGKAVRGLYNGFINSTFYPREIRASSTPTERSMMSGQAFLAGLYPPRGFQVWNKDILWQPVPLYSTSPDNAHRIMECQKFLMQFEQAKLDFYKANELNVTRAMTHYNEATGSNAPNRQVWLVWDKLISESIEGYNIPDWTKPIYPEPLRDIMTKQYVAYYASTNYVVRTIIGNLVEEIIKTIKSKIDGGLANRRMNLYFGHDSSIVSLMVALGVPLSDVPLVLPSSALILELHEDPATSKHFVKVQFIDGRTIVEFGPEDVYTHPVTLSSCGEPCDVDLLVIHTSWLYGVDYDRECHVPNFNTSYLVNWNE